MIRHSLSCYVKMAAAMARSSMQYRFNFLAQILTMVFTYSGQFIALFWLTQRFQTLGGWRLGEIILLYALAILAWGVCVSVFFGLTSFEDMIRNGTFDRALLRPMNPLLHVLANQSPLSGIGQFVFSILAFCFAIYQAGVPLTPLKLVYLLLTTIGGGLIIGATLIGVATITFWTVRSYVFYWSLVYPARQLINYPVSIYNRALQVFLTVAVPFAFINYFPAHLLLDKVEQLPYPVLAWLTPLVGLVAVTVAYRAWTWGARYYTGTGS
jgi:ABC-2 type transport system permease protein